MNQPWWQSKSWDLDILACLHYKVSYCTLSLQGLQLVLQLSIPGGAFGLLF